MIFYTSTSALPRGRHLKLKHDRRRVLQHLPKGQIDESCLIATCIIALKYSVMQTKTRTRWRKCLKNDLLFSLAIMPHTVTLFVYVLTTLLPGQNYFCYKHAAEVDFRFCCGPKMLISKTARQIYNSTWIALSIRGFSLVKTWLIHVPRGTVFMQFFKIISRSPLSRHLGLLSASFVICPLKCLSLSLSLN